MLLLFFLSLVAVSDSLCVSLNTTNRCYGVLPYHNVYASQTCLEELEVNVNTSWNYFNFLSPKCRQLLIFEFCSDTYPECDNDNPKPTCADVCLNATSTDPSGLCSSREDREILAKFENNAGTNFVVFGGEGTKGKNFFPALLDCSNRTNVNCTAYDESANMTLSFDRCEPYAGQVCNGLVTYPVWMHAYETQGPSEQRLLGATIILSSIAESCATPLKKWACVQSFLPCDKKAYSRISGANFTYEPPLPKYPCRQLCDNYTVACPTLIASGLSLVAPLCDRLATASNYSACGTPLFGGYLEWPTVNTIFLQSDINGTGASITVPCFDQLGNTSNVTVAASCPAPLLIAENPFAPKAADGLACSLPCPPSWAFPEKIWNRGKVEFIVVSIPSLIVTTYMFLTWLIFSMKRKQTYVLAFNFCVWMISFILVISLGTEKDDLREVSCKNDADFVSQQDGGYCFLQGFVLFFFALSTVSWWLIVAIHLYTTVVLQKRYTPKDKFQMDIIYNVFGWGIPLFLLVLVYALGGGFGGSQTIPLLICLFDDHTENVVRYITFFIPVGLGCLIGFGLIFRIMYQLHVSANAANLSSRQRCSRQLRPLMFIIQFFIIFFFIFCFYIQEETEAQSIFDSAHDWFECLIGHAGDKTICGEAPKKGLPASLWYGLFFCVGGQGLVNFLSWGTQPNNFYLWKQLCSGGGLGTLLSSKSGMSGDRDKDHIPSRSGNLSPSRRMHAVVGAGKEDAAKDKRDIELVEVSQVDEMESSQLRDASPKHATHHSTHSTGADVSETPRKERSPHEDIEEERLESA